MVDEQTNLKFTKFFTTKNGIIEPTLEKIQKQKNNGLVVKNIQLDNSGENKKLQEQAGSKDWKMNIYFEYTTRGIPWHNYLEDLKFSVLANKEIYMMYRASVPSVMRYQIFPKVFETTTLLERLIVAYIDS